jgi:hypothetical protein
MSWDRVVAQETEQVLQIDSDTHQNEKVAKQS